MISQVSHSLLTICLTSLFSFALVFGLTIENSWASDSPTQLIPRNPIATMESVKTAAKNLEGKTQEAIGNVTNDAKNQIIGKAKQVEANYRKVTENIKDGVEVPERVKANVKNLEGKTQEAFGNLTGNRQDQTVGKAKQLESKIRNLAEDAKDRVKNISK